MEFPGTLTLAPETLLALIVDLAGSVAAHGFRRLVVVDGHGGNDGLIQAAAIKASVGTFQVAALSYWSLIRDALEELSEHDGGDIGHAGELETSIQLHLQPEAVNLASVAPRDCLDLREYASRPNTLPPTAYVPPNPMAESPHGVYGFAPAGTADKGRRIVAAAAERLADFGRPFRRLFQVQKSVKPARCHRVTVAGWTTQIVSFQPLQTRDRRTRSSRSDVCKRGRSAVRWRTASWCRNARFSSTRTRRVLSANRRLVRMRARMLMIIDQAGESSTLTRRTE
jgi:creatinine amidohydrolase/Fe(II)-dependent formamide hydrolase-like protein